MNGCANWKQRFIIHYHTGVDCWMSVTRQGPTTLASSCFGPANNKKTPKQEDGKTDRDQPHPLQVLQSLVRWFRMLPVVTRASAVAWHTACSWNWDAVPCLRCTILWRLLFTIWRREVRDNLFSEWGKSIFYLKVPRLRPLVLLVGIMWKWRRYGNRGWLQTDRRILNFWLLYR
jgi:hypothetical protein